MSSSGARRRASASPRCASDRGLTLAAARAALGAARGGSLRDYEDGPRDARGGRAACGSRARSTSASATSSSAAFRQRRVEVVRAAERWRVEPRSEAARTLNYRYQSLSSTLTDKLMSPFLVEIPPVEDGRRRALAARGRGVPVRARGPARGASRRRASTGSRPATRSTTTRAAEHALRALEGATVRLVACIAQHPNVVEKSAIDRAYR